MTMKKNWHEENIKQGEGIKLFKRLALGQVDADILQLVVDHQHEPDFDIEPSQIMLVQVLRELKKLGLKKNGVRSNKRGNTKNNVKNKHHPT